MNMYRKSLIVLLLLTGAVLSYGAPKAKKPAVKKETVQSSLLSAGDMSIAWSIRGKNLFVQISAPTKGWIAAGFDPVNVMKGANFIIGYVSNNTVVILDEYGTELYKHIEDTQLGGSDDVENKHGSFKNGVTEISFSIPLDSKDPYDKKLEPGKEYKVILAYGLDYDLTKHHAKRYEVKIKL